MRYLDSVSLSKLKNLSLEMRRLASEGASSGRHLSRSKGSSRDFASYRAYVPGDDLRTIDWKVFARQDRFYIREYQAENLLTTQILLDASGSMSFSSGDRSPKWEYACRLAMAVAYLVTAGGDAAGLSVFDDDTREFLPPRASFGHLELMDAALSRRGPGGETDLGGVLSRTAARLKKRSLIVLISDLLGDPEDILRVVKALRARKHELMVLQVLDPQERDLGYDGPIHFEALEGGERLFCDVGELRQSYRREFEKILKLYEATFHGGEIPYTAFFTDRPWDLTLGKLLSRRRRG